MASEYVKNIFITKKPPEIKLARSNFRLVCYIFFYLVAIVLGAAVFSAIEAPDEIRRIKDLRKKRKEFLQRHPCVTDSDLEDFIQVILDASARGVSAAGNVTGEPNWSFGQSFFFSSTIITTIGYGHVHPLSESGKFFCILYAIIGIPMTFILLSAFVERLLFPSTILLEWLNSKLGHLYQPFNIRVFHLSVIAALSAGLFVLLPAVIFENIEPGWNYLDSLYYCFISLTTIGLGDYIPGDARDQPYRPLYKIFITVYLLAGLSFVMLILHLYNDIPQLNFGFFLLRKSDITNQDTEQIRLSTSGITPQKYSQRTGDSVMQNVKVVPRPVESPSPEDQDTTPVHAQSFMLPMRP